MVLDLGLESRIGVGVERGRVGVGCDFGGKVAVVGGRYAGQVDAKLLQWQADNLMLQMSGKILAQNLTFQEHTSSVVRDDYLLLYTK